MYALFLGPMCCKLTVLACSTWVNMMMVWVVRYMCSLSYGCMCNEALDFPYRLFQLHIVAHTVNEILESIVHLLYMLKFLTSKFNSLLGIFLLLLQANILTRACLHPIVCG